MSNKQPYPLTKEQCAKLLGHCFPWLAAITISGQVANHTCTHCGYTERLVQPESYWEAVEEQPND